MSQPVDIDLNLDGNYVDQVGAATQATDALAQSVSAVQARSSGVQRALDAVTPTRAHLAAWGGFTAAAAYYQQQTSGIRATSVAAGQSMRVLEGDVNRLSRQFPIGTAGAVQMVQAIQQLSTQQRNILPLAQTMERLQGATGASPMLATSFGQLNRQLASLDPSRVERFADVVTTLQAKTGASAEGMVSFAHSIAPVAQQAGIGEAGILGISSAFVKLGDDGGAAATAVNKILSDLNRSVREGSNDMAAYAQITGMTVSQFKALYQANPAGALTAVTGAIGRAGPQGQMQLESLGLEGVRTQRALLEASQSGGLQQAINQATSSYGNGSTQRAAAAAFGGLNDQLTELRSTAGQTADALGGPFLHVLTRIVDIAKTPLAATNSVLGSSYGQHLIGGLGAVAITGLLARRVAGPLSALALGGQAATSGPVRSVFGGYALGRHGGDVTGAMGYGRIGRFGEESIAMQAAGAPYGRGFMQPVNRFFMRAGNVLGEAVTDVRGAPGPGGGGGPGLIGAARRAGRAGIAAASMGYEAYARTYADPLVQARLAAGERVSLLTPQTGGLLSTAGSARDVAMAQARQGGAGFFGRQYAGAQAGLGLLERESTASGAALARMAEATMGAARATTSFAGRVVEAGAMVGGRALGGLGSGLMSFMGGPVGLGLTAGLVGYSMYRSSQSSNSAEQNRVMDLDMYSVLNRYRDAMGQAGAATVTLADQMQQASASLAKGITTYDQARTVSGTDLQATGTPTSDHSKVPHWYRGGDASIAGQISSLNLNGLQPSDLQGAKMNLLKQGIAPDRVDRILGMVNTGGGPGGTTTSNMIAGIISGTATASASYQPSALEQIKRHPLPGGTSDWNTIGSGGIGSKPLIGDDGKKTLDLLQGAIMQQYGDLTGHYSQAYAVQTSVRTANQALQDALKTGDPDVVAAVAQRAGQTLTGNKTFHVSAAAVRNAGGDITQLLGKNTVYGQSMADWQRQGVTASGQGVAATRIQGGDYTAIQSAGASALLPFFGVNQARGPYRAGQQAVDYIANGHEADIGAQTSAVNSIVDGAVKAGVSLTDLATQASKATSTTADWQQQLLAAIAAEAQFRQSVALQGAGRAQTFNVKVGADLQSIAAGPGVDPNGFQAKQYEQAKQDLADQRGSIIAFYQQRVMAQRQYQIQVGRSQEDFQRQTSRSEADYLRGRNRAYRDFNIQLTRQVQDAAASMYDPYTRIQAKPVWDSTNLLGNRSEQLGALRQQMANIRELRKLGLDQATIDQLRLYDPNNAQQVQQLVADLQANRGQIGQLNRQSAQIAGAAGALLTQSPEYRRSREDFKRSLSDQRVDFNTSMSRTRQDYNTSMARMAQDEQSQDLEITNNMTKLSKDMHDIMSGRFVDLKGQVTSSLEATLASVNHFMPLINGGIAGNAPSSPGSAKNSGGGGMVAGPGYGTGNRKWTGTPGGFQGEQFARANSKAGVNSGFLLTGASRPGSDMDAMGNPNLHWGKDVLVAPDNRRLAPNAKTTQSMANAFGWGGGPEWAALYQIWQQESGFSTSAGSVNKAYGIPQADPGSKMSAFGSDWRTNPRTQIGWGLNYIASRYGDPLGAWAHKSRTGWYAEGGIATVPQIGVVAEAGSPEAMIPLNARGVSVLAAAMQQYLSNSQAAMIGAGGMTHAIHISTDTYHYDQRLDMQGSEITVKANSPRELGDSLLEKTRSDNLVATRGVNR